MRSVITIKSCLHIAHERKDGDYHYKQASEVYLEVAYFFSEMRRHLTNKYQKIEFVMHPTKNGNDFSKKKIKLIKPLLLNLFVEFRLLVLLTTKSYLMRPSCLMVNYIMQKYVNFFKYLAYGIL
jgi:hypothetical protein